jgi:hypothetical protein
MEAKRMDACPRSGGKERRENRAFQETSTFLLFLAMGIDFRLFPLLNAIEGSGRSEVVGSP